MVEMTRLMSFETTTPFIQTWPDANSDKLSSARCIPVRAWIIEFFRKPGIHFLFIETLHGVAHQTEVLGPIKSVQASGPDDLTPVPQKPK